MRNDVSSGGNKSDMRGNVVIRLVLLICLMLLCVVAGGVATALWHSRTVATTKAAAATPVAKPVATPASRPAVTPSAAVQSTPEPMATTGTVSSNQVQIFFTADGRRLRPQVIEMPRAMSPHERLKFVMEELFRGPMSGSLKAAVPEGTQLVASFIRDDVATIDVSGAILAKPLGGAMAEVLCVNAIAQTVVRNIDSVKSVQILVDSRPVPVLWEQVDLAGPIVPDDSLVQKR